MDIANLLAQGTRARPAGMEQNALMQAQEFKQRQAQNALMQMQMQAAQEKRAQDQQNALMLRDWRNSLQEPQGQQFVQSGAPAMNAAQAESAAMLPGYGVSSAQPSIQTAAPDQRMVQAIRLAKMGQMGPADLFKLQNPEPVKLGKDDRLLQPGPSGSFTELVGATPVAPKATDLPNAVREYQFAVSQGYKGTFEQWDTTRKRAGATNVSLSTGQKGYENESKLRNDFKSEPIYKDFQDMDQAYKQIKSGLSAKSPIGDVAAATKIMKLLDPGSVVRESELGIAMAAAGKFDRLQNYVQMKISGESLTPKQRQDFEALAGDLHAAAAQAYNAKRDEYAKMGNRYGLDETVLGSKSPTVAKPAQAGPQKAGVAVQTATNPKTGEKLQLVNGQWVPAK